jgi:hypothetical protein
LNDDITPVCTLEGEAGRRIEIGRAPEGSSGLPWYYRVSIDGNSSGRWWPYKVHQEEVAHLVRLATPRVDQVGRIQELEALLTKVAEHLPWHEPGHPDWTPLSDLGREVRATLRGESDAD